MSFSSLDDLMKATVFDESGVPEMSEDTAFLLKEAEVVSGRVKEAQILGQAKKLVGKAVEKGKQLLGYTPRVTGAREALRLAKIERMRAAEEAMKRYYREHGSEALRRRAAQAARPARPSLDALAALRGGSSGIPLGLAIGAGTGIPVGMLLSRRRKPDVVVEKSVA